MELVTSSAHKHLSLLLKQREAKQLETMQPFDKALKCGCFGNVKKFQGSLGKKWGHAKRVQKSDILTTSGLDPMWNRVNMGIRTKIFYPKLKDFISIIFIKSILS